MSWELAIYACSRIWQVERRAWSLKYSRPCLRTSRPAKCESVHSLLLLIYHSIAICKTRRCTQVATIASETAFNLFIVLRKKFTELDPSDDVDGIEHLPVVVVQGERENEGKKLCGRGCGPWLWLTLMTSSSSLRVGIAQPQKSIVNGSNHKLASFNVANSIA